MANNKVVLSNGTTLIDLTADTVTAADLMGGKTAHGANGAAIGGRIIDGFTQYKTDMIDFGTAYTNLSGWTLNLGFVPKFFLMYALPEYFDISNIMRVAMLFYNSFRSALPDTHSDLHRFMGAAQWSGCNPRVYSYIETASIAPYEQGNVKGVVGVVSSQAITFRLLGQYRYIALG